MNRKIRIAARVAAYMYSDGIQDGTELHKSVLEIYLNHATPRKIDLAALQTVGEPDPNNPDTLRK